MTVPIPHSVSAILLESEADAMKAVQHAVLGGLLAYNREHAGEPNQNPLILSSRDADGVIVAGLVGVTAFQWLVIHLLWVESAHRGHGIGRLGQHAAAHVHPLGHGP